MDTEPRSIHPTQARHCTMFQALWFLWCLGTHVVVSCLEADIGSTNSIVVGSSRFSTLDGASPTDETLACQAQPYALPSGWSVATQSDDALAAIMSGRWGSDCLILQGGVSKVTRSLFDCGLNSIQEDDDGALVPESCEVLRLRILISAAVDDGAEDQTISPIASLSGSALDSVSFVHNGVRYASLDGTDPASSDSGCQQMAYQVPSGWSIMEDTAATKIAMMGAGHQFGASCYVTSFGLSRYSSDPNKICGLDKLTRVGDAAVMYYGVRDCSRRVLVSREESGVGDSWISILTPDEHIFAAHGFEFATMDHHDPNDNSAGCQGVGLMKPSGWDIAEPGDAATRALVSKHFGTSCLILNDGHSYTHSGGICLENQLTQLENEDGDVFYAPKDCEQRVLLQRAADLPGLCVSWGDPHFTTFDGYQYDFFGVGDFILLETANSEMTVHARHFATGRASSNQAVGIQLDGAHVTIETSHGTNEPLVILDGVEVDLSGANTEIASSSGVVIAKSGELKVSSGDDVLPEGDDNMLRYTVSSPTSSNMVIVGAESASVQYLHFWIHLDNTHFDDTRGLCGLWDYDAGSDFINVDGSIQDPDGEEFTASELHDWGMQWQLTDIEDSILPYGVTSASVVNGTFEVVKVSAGTLDEVRQTCLDLDMDLAHIASEEQNALASEVCGSEECYIGLHRAGDEGGTEPFVWRNGQAPSYTNWQDGQPGHSDGLVETVVVLCGLWCEPGQWSDWLNGEATFAGLCSPVVSVVTATPLDFTADDDWEQAYDFSELDFEDQDVAIQTCRSRNLLDSFYLQCLSDVAMTGDTSVVQQAVNAQYEDVLERFGGDTCADLEAPTINESSVRVSNGRRYALLVDEGENPASCSSAYIRIPEGWEVALDEPYTRAAISCETAFQSIACIILRDGTSLDPATMEPCSDDTSVRYRGSQLTCAEPVNVCGRVLIVQEDDLSYPVVFDNADFEAVTDDAFDSWEYYEQDNGAPGVTYTVSGDGEGKGGVGRSMRMELSNEGESRGAKQSIAINQLSPESFRVGVWSKAVDVTGVPDDHYALHFDLDHGAGTWTYGVTARFNVGTHGWEFMAVDVSPAYPIQDMHVFLLFRQVHVGTVWFDGLTITAPAGNALPNPSFDILSAQSNSASTFWFDFNGGFTTTTQTEGRTRYAIKAEITTDIVNQQKAGAIQQVPGSRIPVRDGEEVTLYFGGWSKAEEVGGSKDPYYSIYLDIFFEDGTAMYSQVAEFRVGTHDWEFSHGFVTVDRPILFLNVVPMLQGRKGIAWFDDVFVTILHCTKNIRAGQTYGDPHLLTLDGVAYDLHTIAEFTLLRDTSSDWEVQARHSEAGIAAVNSAAAVRCSGHKVALYRAVADAIPSIQVDGIRVIFETKVMFPDSDNPVGSITRSGSLTDKNNPDLKFVFSCFENGYIVEVEVFESTFEVQFLVITPLLPPNAKSNVEGLLGNWNGDASDDVVDDDGNTLDPSSTPHSELYSKFGYRWQVDETTSIFSYKVGQDHNSVINLNHFPDDPLEGMSDQEVAVAEEVCSNANLEGAAKDNCVLDVLVSGDLTFVAATQGVSNSTKNPATDVEGVEQVQIEGSITIPEKGSIEPTDAFQVLIDECESDLHDCHPAALCIDTTAAYSCVCAPGYSGSGTDCEDVDECSFDQAVCQDGTTCNNVDGGYTCECDDDGACDDVDECALGTHECDSIANCFNTDGGYNCICPSGFDGNGFVCIDVDECQQRSHGCTNDLACTNIAGGYMCSDGDVLSVTGGGGIVGGTTTIPTATTGTINTNPGEVGACSSGYEEDEDGVACIDIDECERNLHVCATGEGVDCHNLPGTYSCSCGSQGTWYDYSSTSIRCIDELGIGVSGTGTFSLGPATREGPVHFLLVVLCVLICHIVLGF